MEPTELTELAKADVAAGARDQQRLDRLAVIGLEDRADGGIGDRHGRDGREGERGC